MKAARFACLQGLLAAATLCSAVVDAEQIKVRHPQGAAHGFVEVTTLEGTRMAVGDLVQRIQGDLVTSELAIHFFDGSLDDETTVFSQRGVFRLVSDHHIQRGPTFPNPMDATVDLGKRVVSSTDPAGRVTHTHMAMPADVYNGLTTGMLMNLSPTATQTRISIVVPGEKPRIAQLSLKSGGELTFTMGGVARKAVEYTVHVELGGIAGVVAPLIGKEPLDYHVWILQGPDPAFIREEGQLYQGGPVWRIQQISAVFSQ